MLLSVVLPALNEEGSIGSTLDHLIALDPFEIFVVDGGSSDRTYENASALSPSHPRSSAEASAG